MSTTTCCAFSKFACFDSFYLDAPTENERQADHRAIKGIARRLLTPLGTVWVLCHTVMVLLGALFLSSAALHATLGAGLSEGIGGSLIASGIAGVSLFLYVSATETLRSQIETFNKAGLSNVYAGRSVLIRDAYQKRLADAQRIDLIGYAKCIRCALRLT